MDAVAAPGATARPVAANRGASGIDGTVASAAGFAWGLARPVTLLIGDLALLHDLNSLALLRACRDPFVLVLINNDGGGIFSFLPIAGYPDVFEPYFGTPHGLTFEAAASLFGLAYSRPATPEAFGDAYAAACRHPGGTLIEVRTDRRENRDLHERLLAAVAGSGL
jgi:2-succinyl-5-enolpyruvyl-6-hydroxy-3-cyclohexene-1-carboxylate synthase